jgi:hypothetical protein
MTQSSESVVAHPGYRWMYGMSQLDAPKPFYWVTYEDAEKGEPTTRRFAYVDTYDEARAGVR